MYFFHGVICSLTWLCFCIAKSSSICISYLETNCHDIVYTGDCNIPGNATLLYDINFVGVYSGNRSLPNKWKSSVDHPVSLLSLSWKWCHCTLLDWCWDWKLPEVACFVYTWLSYEIKSLIGWSWLMYGNLHFEEVHNRSYSSNTHLSTSLQPWLSNKSYFGGF